MYERSNLVLNEVILWPDKLSHCDAVLRNLIGLAAHKLKFTLYEIFQNIAVDSSVDLSI